MAQDIKAREAGEDVAPSLKPIYERLSQMKMELEQLCKLVLDSPWRDACRPGPADLTSVDASVDAARDRSLQVRPLSLWM
jgi:hypothetical protein